MIGLLTLISFLVISFVMVMISLVYEKTKSLGKLTQDYNVTSGTLEKRLKKRSYEGRTRSLLCK